LFCQQSPRSKECHEGHLQTQPKTLPSG
jgi:hypothetical protein